MPRFERHHEGSAPRRVQNPVTGAIERVEDDPSWTRTVIVSQYRQDEPVVRLSLEMGSASRRIVRRFPEGPFFARMFVVEVTTALLNAGYTMTSESEQLTPANNENDPTELLLERMADGDIDAYLVHADGLLDRGDPRGELITLLTKDPKDPDVRRAVKAWMDAHPAAELVPPEIAPRLSQMHPVWRLGFLSSIQIEWSPDFTTAPRYDAAAMIRILSSHPVAHLLQTIVVGAPHALTNTQLFFDLGRPMTGLALYGPESLRSITLSCYGPCRLGEATFMWLAFPRLEELVLGEATHLDLGAIVPRALRALTLDTCDSNALAALERTPLFPALDTLTLGVANFTDVDVDHLVELVGAGHGRKRFPKLRRVAFPYGGPTDDLVDRLSRQLPDTIEVAAFDIYGEDDEYNDDDE